MAFTQTETFTLVQSARAMHSLENMVNKLENVGMYVDGITSDQYIGHDIFQAMDKLSDIFLVTCKIYKIDSNMHSIADEDISTPGIEAALADLMTFVNSKQAESNTDIIRFATELRTKYAVKS